MKDRKVKITMTWYVMPNAPVVRIFKGPKRHVKIGRHGTWVRTFHPDGSASIHRGFHRLHMEPYEKGT